MKQMVCLALALPLAGCVASGPEITVQALNGKYYVRGSDCVQYTMVADLMKCMNESGQFTYDVDGLTAVRAQPINFKTFLRK